MPANVVVPEVGESIVDARVAKWLKKEGDAVAVGEPLVELETDKIDLEVAAPQAGVLGRIAHADGADVKVGEVLAVIEEGAAATSSAPPREKAEAAKRPSPAEAAPAAKADGSEKLRSTPAARNVAQEKAVDLTQVPGTGDAGRVMKRDVESTLAARTPKQAPAAPAREERRPEGERTEERVRMTKRRATIARRLVEAQSTAAMLTTFNEVDMSAVMALRERHKQPFKERHGVGLGLTAFFVKASIGALREFPRINAEIQGDEIVFKNYYDIGMAVGAEGGLVVPVIRDADRKGFVDIELAIRDFARRAQDGTLTLEDLKGGTFTITNGGVFGSLMSTPILNPPQVGILGLHKIADRAVVLNGQVVIRPMMYVALSYDHRIVDGREAVQFLVKIKDYIEDPAWMLLEG